ncbi:MAG: L,D-transpeptidase family protein [Myxococcales bacterium]|nr:L,D-transpeptidase family protein [Myxococcales bacterium]MCB9578997.1 L,D-transpeptidase family protein [Polyangiaceae bacterium]
MRARSLLWLALAMAGCGKKPAGAEVPPEPSRAPAPPEPTAILYQLPKKPPAVAALSPKVYIRSAPAPGAPEIGAIHIGTWVDLKQPKPVGTNGCAGGWVAVEPEGYVCLDRSTTLDIEGHPLLAAIQKHQGDFSAAAPYRWAESREAPLYRRLPTEEEQARSEYDLERHLRRVDKARKDPEHVPSTLAGVDLRPATGSVPGFLADGAVSPWSQVNTPGDPRVRAGRVPTRSSIAYTDEFFANGRSWLLTSDLLLVPKDRVVPLEPATFAGVHLDEHVRRLPLAFIRREPRPKFRFVSDATAKREPSGVVPAADFTQVEDAEGGHFEETGATFERLAWVGLTGHVRRSRSVRYLETRDDGIWIREDDATVVQSEPPKGFELAPGEKWIDVSIFRGTLVAYEGRQAVFATLISPGMNGYKRINGEPGKYTTPTGTFRMEWKHLSTTMSPDPKRMSYYLSEVPYTQFFHMPFALHAAYWHDRFGEPKSGGCVNLSVKDAQWLFGWTDPKLPDGWHSVRSGGDRGEGTWVRVH